MVFSSSTSALLLTPLLSYFSGVGAAPSAASDPCAAIGGKTFVPPTDALACLKSFPFNETLRQNVLQNVARTFDLFTFEEFYLNSPPPFQESTTNIRDEIVRINRTTYATDFDFNFDLYTFINQLNDGHTRWLPSCYVSAFKNILPAPIVTFEENGIPGVFVTPDSVELFSLLGTEFTSFFDSVGFNWQRLAGARVLAIEGTEPFDYVDLIARTVSGNFLDHGVRVNSVFSSYRIAETNLSQRVGDLAESPVPTQTHLTMKLITVNSTEVETVQIPFLAEFVGVPFTDKASYWANNCAAIEATNGVDVTNSGISAQNRRSLPLRAKAIIIDGSAIQAIGLPGPFVPDLPQVDPNSGVIKSYILPDGKTGVMFIGSFSDDFVRFQTDTVNAFKAFKEAGVTQLLIDVTNNGGGFVCLGQFLHQFMAGSQLGFPGFQSTIRGSALSKKIVANVIELGVTETFYAPSNWAFLNDTVLPDDYNYLDPTVPFFINGKDDPTSQRFHEVCTPFDVPIPTTPQIPLENIAIVSNGNCASTCAMFSTVMNERHQTKIGVFGGRLDRQIEFKGMAGNQVLEWSELDTEIRSANLKDDPLAPPDLLVNGNFRHNWRTAWSFVDENKPIAYLSELPKFRFAYTKDTYNNPQNLWIFAAKQMLG